eukprot:TRINITY_DN5611_c0_g2_i1.p1 TRINITY_DN5611_c0_g2~~TRINITY_DN5611_c0_g2_i1.p1  ORF type:complete len:125 (-),score=29.36 TRINITY_DN5611_c0_g2_i1:158-532(-)
MGTYQLKFKKMNHHVLPPKRPLSAFFQFKKDVYDEVKSHNPDLKITELIKVIAEMWKDLDEATRKKYDDIAQEAKEKYRLEKQEYEEKYGNIQSSMPFDGLFVTKAMAKETIAKENPVEEERED